MAFGTALELRFGVGNEDLSGLASLALAVGLVIYLRLANGRAECA